MDKLEIIGFISLGLMMGLAFPVIELYGFEWGALFVMLLGMVGMMSFANSKGWFREEN